MTTQSIQTALGLGIVGSVALAFTSPANAQSSSIPVTGGRVVFGDTQIFVPFPNSINDRTLVFEGSTPDSVFIRTTQGNIPINAKFTSTILPSISSSPGEPPRIGDTGQVLGTLTFRGFTAAGEPGLFANIPTTLDFQITSGNFNSAVTQEFTKYETAPATLTETGFIATPTSFTLTERTTPVVIVQFQPGSNPPQELTLTDVTPVTTFAPSDFINSIPGTSYAVSFDANLTGGSVDIPTPPGFNPSGSPSGNLNSNTNGFNNITAISTIFIDRSVTVFGTNRLIGFTQASPVLPTTFVVGIFTFTNVRSGVWFDPPITESFEYEMMPRDIPIGIASRVFPGVIGRDTASDAVFTAISGFPEGVDEDDRFTVSVEGRTLGEFGPGDTLQFSNYAEELGDLLVNDGVSKFTVSAINPGVDSADPTAFPLKLEFNTPTASFEMRALDTDLSQGTSFEEDEQAVEVSSNVSEPVESISATEMNLVSEESVSEALAPSEATTVELTEESPSTLTVNGSTDSPEELTTPGIDSETVQPQAEDVEQVNADSEKAIAQLAEGVHNSVAEH